jgi:hypothetical protein
MFCFLSVTDDWHVLLSKTNSFTYTPGPFLSRLSGTLFQKLSFHFLTSLFAFLLLNYSYMYTNMPLCFVLLKQTTKTSRYTSPPATDSFFYLYFYQNSLKDLFLPPFPEQSREVHEWGFPSTTCIATKILPLSLSQTLLSFSFHFNICDVLMEHGIFNMLMWHFIRRCCYWTHGNPLLSVGAGDRVKDHQWMPENFDMPSLT